VRLAQGVGLHPGLVAPAAAAVGGEGAGTQEDGGEDAAAHGKGKHGWLVGGMWCADFGLWLLA